MIIYQILEKYWGYKQFRPLQEEIIQSILNKKDTLALLPTGGGKSICFQVPAMTMNGLCLVVSPLIALIKDQVENLDKKGIPALMIYSGIPYKQVNNILQNAINGAYKFLYVSPERLETKLFQDYLPAMNVALIAVDEAHCISQWGYDFRPPYLRIASIRESLQDVPIIALTASATTIVQKDICEKLLFSQPNIFQKSFKRANLSYSVLTVESKINKTVDILNAVSGTAIIYCKSRRRTKEVSDLLRYYNINAAYYHAGLSNEERTAKQKDWIDNKIRVMVCTNAFGMGIDKPDVRVVIHYDVPDCLENYYQESGRAGRDEKKAFAILLYQDEDLVFLQQNVAKKYPEESAIKNVYLSICNYYQLVSGSAEGTYFDFDINDFCKKFKLDVLLVMNSLKALEQEGLISFTEYVFMPPMLQIIADKNTLGNFGKNNPRSDNLLKLLLRNYGGILDYPVIISEKNIAYLLKNDVEQVKQDLYQLQKMNVLVYNPVKETPQLYFIKERIHSENFSLNVHQYQQRKKNYQQKIDKMIAYVQLKNSCRSIYISTYFGVKDTENCGTCDECLAIKKKQMAFAELEQIMFQIMRKLADDQSISLVQLQTKIMKHYNIEKVKKAVDFLLAEEKIVLKEDTIRLKQ